MIHKSGILHIIRGGRLLFAIAAAFSAVTPVILTAQEPVRRAEPARGTEQRPVLQPFNPSTTPSGIEPPPVLPIPRASVPFNTTIPRAEPARPAATPLPRPAAGGLPVMPQASADIEPASPSEIEIAPGDPAARPGDIRIGPGSTNPGAAEEALFESAEALFNRKDFANALAFYDRLLKEFPRTRHRQDALYRIGACLVETAQPGAAMAFFRTLLDEFKDGRFVGPAAYRLAEIYFAAGNYFDALPNYRLAADRLNTPQLALRARFHQARCAQEIGREAEARALFAQVSAAPEPNVFREASLQALARLSAARSDKSEALKSYAKLVDISKNPALRADAALNAGLIAADLGRADDARKFLAIALQADPKGSVGEVARLAEMRLLDAQKDYPGLLASYNASGGISNPDLAPEAMVLAGKAMRKTGKIAEAQAMFEEVLRRYPGSPQAEEAAYQRLAGIYESGSDTILEEAEEFLRLYPTSSNAARARLMQGEFLSKNGRFAEAAAIYSALLTSDLPQDWKAQNAYRLAISQFKAGSYDDAIRSFSYFIQKFPADPYVPAAICERGQTHFKKGDIQNAILDFDTVIARFPKSTERELAILRKAIALGAKGDDEAMAETYRQLLREYPKTKEAARANYWIGHTLFLAKDYQGAIPHLDEARRRDAESYYGRATQRILTSYYFLQQADDLAREIEAYKPGKGDPPVSREIVRWLGITLADQGKNEEAERYLAAVAKEAGDAPDDAWYHLARVRNALSKWVPAAEAADRALKSASDPAARSRALIERAKAEIGAGRYQPALATIGEITELSPEGPLYAEALLLHGDLLTAQGDPAQAAKHFNRVALLFEEPTIKPRALLKSSEALRKSGDIAGAEEALNRLKTQFPEYPIPAN